MLEITIQRYALRSCARAHFHALPFELRKYVAENFRRTLIFFKFSSCWACGRIIRKFAPSENYPLYGIYMTKIFRCCTISVGLAPLANYSENSDNSTDKRGSLRSPLIQHILCTNYSYVIPPCDEEEKKWELYSALFLAY